MDGESSQCVKVAVIIRPLVTTELLAGCTDCITVYPVQKQVQIGSHSFTFDYVFGSRGAPSSTIYDCSVAPVVDALFEGYNGTVLAYGQTGSGKTYTMGTNYQGEENGDAIIPKVMDTIFSRVEGKESTEFEIRVSFIEVFKEDIFDLLDRSARVPIQIRETVSGAIALAGVTEPEVRTKDEMRSFLLQGSLSRATGSTEMNSQSSRSHAIFTISMGQRRCGDDVLMAKLHLVDLAGSERAKRTGAHGSRLQEGIHINKGLLALGNVISALGDKKRKGGHIPYRDHKLTRILQDSLGGNCKTIMIACVSPADINAEETLNCLKYANRAKNILNKAIINRDPMTAEMQKMQSQIEELQSELLHSSLATEEIKILKHKVSLLEASKIELQQALQDCRISCQHVQQRAIDAQMEKDRLVMKIESIRNEINGESDKDFDLLKSYITRIQELECELVIIRSSNQLRRGDSDDFLYSRDYGSLPRNLFMDSDIRTEETLGVVEDVEKELQHSSIREQLDRELKELDQRLEQKEKEIDELRHNLANISSNSDDSAQKLKEEHLQKLNTLESQVVQLKKKQDAQAQLLRQKLKGDEAAKRLQDDIQRIKTQKVLQRKSEEADMATKRLKDLLDTPKAPREASGSNRGPGIRTIEHELEVTIGVHGVRSEYERQMKERAKMAEELARLEGEASIEKQQNFNEFPQAMSPGARNSRILSLKNMLATSSSTLVYMASQLSEAEERERAFSGIGRRNQVYSMAEAKNVMDFLFDLASSSRCQLKDREVECREKESENRDLKERVANLVRQLELVKAEFSEREKSMKLAYERQSNMNDIRASPLQPLGSRMSSEFYDWECLEDMDTTDDSHQANDDEWSHSRERERRPSKKRISKSTTNHEGVRCSCSRNSSCRTSRCECRAARGHCSSSCNCQSTRCSNRKVSEVMLRPSGDTSVGEEAETSNDLAAHGAMLLQTALSEPHVNQKQTDGTMRKSLPDIGNSLGRFR